MAAKKISKKKSQTTKKRARAKEPKKPKKRKVPAKKPVKRKASAKPKKPVKRKVPAKKPVKRKVPAKKPVKRKVPAKKPVKRKVPAKKPVKRKVPAKPKKPVKRKVPAKPKKPVKRKVPAKKVPVQPSPPTFESLFEQVTTLEVNDQNTLDLHNMLVGVLSDVMTNRNINPEYVKRDGSIGKNPCRYRWSIPEPYYTRIREQLEDANGDYLEMLEISSKWNIPIRELYTLFYSP